MLLSLLFVLLGAPSHAQYAPRSMTYPYYGAAFYARLRGGEAGDSLKASLREILRSDHRAIQGRYDEILPSCQGPGCYRHVVIGYDRARTFLMGSFYLVQQGNGFAVRDVYCERLYTNKDFRGRPPGPGRIPDDKIVNTEHTWPQSRFTGRYPKEEQKSDLHHLFPTDSQMNSTRSSFEFGPVTQDAGRPLKCPQAKFGRGPRGAPVFEPPNGHKGNVARALFYFSTRYDIQISPTEEMALRRWNFEDPVDAEEMNRNNEIFKLQGSRNPYIDHPELAERVRDF